MERFLLLVALPVVLACAAIEACILSRRNQFDWKAMAISIFDLIGRSAIAILVPVSIASPIIDFAWRNRLTTIQLDALPAMIILFFGQEFFYYWYHRGAHRVRWFWCHHSVHHSPNELNLSAAFRVGLIGKLVGTAVFFVPLIWIGFAPRVVAATLALNLLYQFWIHATWIPKLGWMEHVFNTPSSHRVHHAANLEYLDANFGGVLIIFDRLFGTYMKECDNIPCRYGLVQPQTSYNPLRVEFDEWVSLFKDLMGARSVRAFIGYIVMPPGWNPNGKGETTEELRQRNHTAIE